MFLLLVLGLTFNIKKKSFLTKKKQNILFAPKKEKKVCRRFALLHRAPRIQLSTSRQH